MQKSLLIKLTAIIVLCIMFLAGMTFVKGLVGERQYYHQDVMSQIKQAHVDKQILTTPFLFVQNGNTSGFIFASNSTIDTNASVRDDQYQRGIYSAISYQSTINVNQTFHPTNEVVYAKTEDGNQTPTHPAKPTTDTKPTLKPLKLIIALSDLRGITPTDVHINGKSYPAKPNLDKTLNFSYLEVVLPMTYNDFIAGEPLTVSFELQVAGMESFGVVPAGDNVNVKLTSNWQDPKFYGAALPSQKSITDGGFDAMWQTHTIANHNQANIICHAQNACTFDNNTALMTDFVQAQDTYTLTDRTIKYALLLIMICFGTFFLFETIKGLRIHPIQYGLVASGLLIFYVLLLSLAEHIAFSMAYLIAASACVGLIGWYTCYVLSSIKRGLGFTLILASLYAGFYMVLSANGFNLLLGAVFCFVLVGIAMYATRHIDWYNLQHHIATPKNPSKANAHEDT